MLSKVPLKLVALGIVALFVWWFLAARVSVDTVGAESPSEGERAVSTLASSIQPISEAEAAELRNGSVSGRFTTIPIDQAGSQDLKQRFAKANSLIESQQHELAMKELDSLIVDYPSTPELYANLGSLYASNGQLELARKTFKSGIEANQKAGFLFEGLQKIHGALAANAYKKALDATSPDSKPEAVSLPMVEAVETSLDQDRIIAGLRAQLDSQQSEVNSTQSQLSRLASLQAELDDSEKKVATLMSEHQVELKKLQDELTKQSEVLLASQTAEREAQARVVRAEEAASAQVTEELAKAEADKLALLAEKDSIIARQKQEAKRLQEQVQAKPVVTTPVITSTQVPDRTAKAIERVQSWARSWAAQDVDAYVAHYREDYTPGTTISRQQWLEQRRVRLTNKTFIEVDVRQFTVRDLGDQYSVTFTQHYRSNTVDDIIRKRLIFEKRDDDWTSAKIVSERRVAS